MDDTRGLHPSVARVRRVTGWHPAVRASGDLTAGGIPRAIHPGLWEVMSPGERDQYLRTEELPMTADDPRVVAMIEAENQRGREQVAEAAPLRAQGLPQDAIDRRLPQIPARHQPPVGPRRGRQP